MESIAEKIDRLRYLAQAATPGPWYLSLGWSVRTEPSEIYMADEKNGMMFAMGEIICEQPVSNSDADNAIRKANAAFIAAANPETVLWLIELYLNEA